MPELNLSALSAAELRRTLDSSRARGDATTAYEVLREMAARREARAARGPLARRRAGAPHLVSVDLSDPLDRDDEREDRLDAPEPEPEPLGLSLRLPDPPTPDDMEDIPLSLHREPPPSRQAQPRRSSRGIVGFALGIACGVGLGWWAAGMAAQSTSSVAPPVVAEAPEAALPEPQALDVSVAEAEITPMPAPDVAQPAVVAVEPEPTPEAIAPVEAAEAPLAESACAAEPTPADRAICGDPALKTLQQELRTAYAEALEAHADKALLRQRQLAWRDGRSGVTDPGQLAALYEARISRLRAATAAARTR